MLAGVLLDVSVLRTMIRSGMILRRSIMSVLSLRGLPIALLSYEMAKDTEVVLVDHLGRSGSSDRASPPEFRRVRENNGCDC
jgi:hypothetical protein